MIHKIYNRNLVTLTNFKRGGLISRKCIYAQYKKNVVNSSPGLSFLLKNDYITSSSSGVYILNSLGTFVVDGITTFINDAMKEINCVELRLPTLISKQLLQKSGRFINFPKELFQFDKNENLLLAPTHEEVITDLISKQNLSYKSTPLLVYQIGNKYRNEERPRGGLLRTKEFSMMDLYSFDSSEIEAKKTYEIVFNKFVDIFNQLQLNPIPCIASNGNMGGSYSHEFQLINKYGEDKILQCPNCGYSYNSELNVNNSNECSNCHSKERFIELNTLEIAHTFYLDQYYSKALDCKIKLQDNSSVYAYMCCFGIGITRLFQTLAETNIQNSGKSLIWPRRINPFHVCILVNKIDDYLGKFLQEICDLLSTEGINVLLDDRENVSFRSKLGESKIYGSEMLMIIGDKYKELGIVEIENCKSGNKAIMKKSTPTEIVKCVKHQFEKSK